MIAGDAARNVPAKAIGWMLASMAFFVITAMIVRGMTDRMHPVQIVCFRAIFGLVVLAPAIWRLGLGGLRTNHMKLHLMRGALNYGAVLCSFIALAVISVAEVASLQFTLPLITMLLALFFLKEPVPVGGWLACLIGFIGAMIILRPGIEVVSYASILALISAFGYAGANVTLRFIAGHDSPLAIVVLANLIMLPLAFVPALFFWSWPVWTDYGWLFLMALVNTAAQYALTRAFFYGSARVVMPFDFFRLPFAAVLGLIIFSEFPDIWTWVGAGVIFASAYYVLYRETGRGKAGAAAEGFARARNEE